MFGEEGNVDPCEDDCLVGNRGSTEEEFLINDERNLRRVMKILKEIELVVNKNKTHLFEPEVEICGQNLDE